MEDIPLDDHDEFDAWLRDRWYEKDALMETYMQTGRFPPMAHHFNPPKSAAIDYVETEVRTKYWWEFLQIFVVVGVFGLFGNIVAKVWFSFTRMMD